MFCYPEYKSMWQVWCYGWMRSAQVLDKIRTDRRTTLFSIWHVFSCRNANMRYFLTHVSPYALFSTVMIPVVQLVNRHISRKHYFSNSPSIKFPVVTTLFSISNTRWMSLNVRVAICSLLDGDGLPAVRLEASRHILRECFVRVAVNLDLNVNTHPKQ